MAEPIRANIAEMIRLIGSNLYTSHDVVVRELIQNAYDSVNRRYGADASKLGEIVLSVTQTPATLTMQDNGEGMDRRELEDYLSVLGQSVKALQAAKSKSRPTIGEYGIGFFSAFMIADSIIVRTRKPDSKQLFTWRTQDTDKYEIVVTDAGAEAPGTTINLILQRGQNEYAKPTYLSKLISRFCSALDCPIRLNGSVERLNTGTFPWELTSRGAQEKWLESHFNTKPHFFKVGSYSRQPEFNYAFCYSGPAGGNAEIFAKRMFVTSSLNFVPDGFEFINVVINCDELTLNLARDNVNRNATTGALWTAIEDLLWDFLGDLLVHRRQDQQLAEHLHELNPAMARRALATQSAAAKFAPFLLFTTSGAGVITLPEYLEKAKLTDNVVLFAHQVKTNGMTSTRGERLLLLTCEEKKIPVIIVEKEQDEELLRRVCIALKARKTRLQDYARFIVDDASGKTVSMETVRALFAQFVHRPVRLAKIKPAALPLSISGDEVLLNESNLFIVHLAKVKLSGDRARVLYGRCFEVCQTLNSSGLEQKSLESLMQSLTMTFVTWADELRKAEAVAGELNYLTDRWWSGPRSILDPEAIARPAGRSSSEQLYCFMACPFSAAYVDVFNVCRDTGKAFGIIVEKADNFDTQDILIKICRKMDRCDFALIDVSENNPNVMFELGIVLARRKPAILLRDRTKAEDLRIKIPADIIGIERLEYSNTSEELKSKLEKIFASIVAVQHA